MPERAGKGAVREYLTQSEMDRIRSLVHHSEPVPTPLVARLLHDHDEWMKRAFAASRKGPSDE